MAGDLEQLPFAPATFDKAYCLSAIHHIPDIPSALAELHRVLTPQGAVLFSEPGVGHAGQAGSVTAMRDFGVLEQDIVAADFMAACTRVGFAHVSLRPMSYLLPEFQLTRSQWEAWARLATSTRPARAAHTLWRGVLELLGRGKHDVLMEETLAMYLVRLLRAAMADHPVIVAAKSHPVAQQGETRRAEIQISWRPPHVPRPRRARRARLQVRSRRRRRRVVRAPGLGHGPARLRGYLGGLDRLTASRTAMVASATANTPTSQPTHPVSQRRPSNNAATSFTATPKVQR